MSLPNQTRALALHTAARRYCECEFHKWASRYAELRKERAHQAEPGSSYYTPEDYDTFPRYLVLDAIRIEVERLDPESGIDADEMFELLLLAGQCGESVFTKDPKPNEIESNAQQQERDKFDSYLRQLTDDALRAIDPMPYRRVMNPSESQEKWSALRERWAIEGHYWYPLADKPQEDVAAFHASAFDEAITADSLRSWLQTRGITRAWEFGESIPSYTLDIDLLFPLTSEGYSSSKTMDWIVYESHEGSTTVGGWLLQEIRAAWPDWENHLWEPDW